MFIDSLEEDAYILVINANAFERATIVPLCVMPCNLLKQATSH